MPVQARSRAPIKRKASKPRWMLVFLMLFPLKIEADFTSKATLENRYFFGSEFPSSDRQSEKSAINGTIRKRRNKTKQKATKRNALKQEPVGLLYKLPGTDLNRVLSLKKSIKKSVNRVLEFVSSSDKCPQKSTFRERPDLLRNGLASVGTVFIKYRQRLIISSRRPKA